MLLVFVVALAIRLPHLASAPDDFHTMRQYHGQLLARWLHDAVAQGDTSAAAQGDTSAAAPRVDLEDTSLLEAPVLPGASTVGFLATGGESWWVPRSINVLAWLLGGWMLMRLCLESTGSRRAALVAAVCFLLAPFGVSLSRSVQPDTMMIVATIGAWWAAVRAVRAADEGAADEGAADEGAASVEEPVEEPVGEPEGEPVDGTDRAAVLALGIATAFAVLVKGVAAFLIVPVVLALLVGRHGWTQLWRRRPLRVTVVAVALPSVLYYAASIALGAPLRGQLHSSVVPSMLVDPAFWSSWFTTVLSVVGLIGLCSLIAALTVCARGTLRSVLAGATVGFVAMGLFFSYRSATHDYYAAPLIAVVALAVGAVADRGLEQLERRSVRPAAAAAMALVLLAVGVGAMGRAPRWAPTVTDARRASIEAAAAELPPGGRVLMVDGHYGNQLRHDTGLRGASWPTQADLDLDTLTGATAVDPSSRLDQLLDEGVAHLVTTIDPSRVIDPSTAALFELVEDCVVERVGEVRVVELGPCVGRT